MEDREYVVRYYVDGLGTQQSGSYQQKNEAEQHRADIAGYEWVSWAHVFEVEVPITRSNT